MPSRQPPSPGHLLAQAQCTAAAIVVALVLRRLDRLNCAAAAPAAADAALCRALAALSGRLAFDLNLGAALLGAAAAILLLARLLVRLVRKPSVYIVDFTVHRPDARCAGARPGGRARRAIGHGGPHSGTCAAKRRRVLSSGLDCRERVHALCVRPAPCAALPPP